MYRKKGHKRPKQLTDKAMGKRVLFAQKPQPEPEVEIILTKSGKPYKSERSAKGRLNKLKGSYMIIEYGSGFAIQGHK